MSKLGKFLTGVSEVAVPAALENQRAKIQAMRDERMNSFQSAENAKQRDFTAGENAAGRAHQSEESALTRAQQSRQHSESIALQREGQQATLEYQGMQYMASEAERKDRLKVVEAQLASSKLDQELKTIELDDAKQMREAYDAVMNADLSDEERLNALEYVNLRNPRSDNKFVATQLKDEFGDPIMEVSVLNQETGEVSRLDLAAAPAGRATPGVSGRNRTPGSGGADAAPVRVPYADAMEVREAFRKGEIDRAKATEYLSLLAEG